MQPVLITIHLLIVIALVGVVLIQRSEGGGLGIGGGSGFMTARGTRNALTRLTAVLAGVFFLTSIILTVLQATSNPVSAPDLLDQISTPRDDFGPLLGGQGSSQPGNDNVQRDDGAVDISVPQDPAQTSADSEALSMPVPDIPHSSDNGSALDQSEPTDGVVSAPLVPDVSPVPDR